MILKTKHGTFNLVNEEKVRRVLEGTTDAKGRLLSGLGHEAVEKQAERVLAEYDKLAGAIKTEEGSRVKYGCFYDVVNKKEVEKPEVVLTYKINGETVEVKQGEKTPEIVEAAKVLEKQKADKVAKKATK